MAPGPLDTGKYHARLDALRVSVGARDAETASGPETEASADAAYERHAALRDQDGPAPGPKNELEARS